MAKIRLVKIALLLFVLSAISSSASAKYSGGTGEPNTPYQIADANDLLALSADANDHDLSFILTADINLANHNFTDSVIPSFSGNFNGNNYVIENIHINANDGYDVGFFGKIYGAKIENLNLENIDVNSISIFATGGLAGNASYSYIINNTYTISNIPTITNCRVTGTITSSGRYNVNYSGGLIGKNYGGTINNCSFQGSVVNNVYGAGGLVGTNLNNGTIINSFTNCYVESKLRTGGFVGSNYGYISNCFATGNISTLPNSANAGGFVGHSCGCILNSGCITNINCQDEINTIGGFIGLNHFNNYYVSSGIIKNCYAQGTIDANKALQIGGFAGNSGGSRYAVTEPNEATGNCVIENCYSATTIDSNDYTTDIGGFAGANFDSKIKNCFWDQQILPAEITEPIAFDANSITENLIGLTTTKMKTQTSYTDFDFINTLSDGYHNHWLMPENNYPILSWQSPNAVLVPDVAGLTVAQAQQKLADAGLNSRLKYIESLSIPAGQLIGHFYFADSYALEGDFIELYVSAGNTADGSASNPYPISCPQDLEYLTTNTNLYDKSFILIRDIDLDDREYDAAIINPFQSGEPNTPFSGTFDGNDHTITNLTFNIGNCNNYAIALFSTTTDQAIIKNLTLDNVTMTKIGDLKIKYIAALVGDNAGTITGCDIKTIIDAEEISNIGGLCGKNSGSIENCFANTIILASKYYAGGLIGTNSGDVTNCSAKVNIKAWSVGGLIGANEDSTVQSCHTTGNIITCHNSETGGLIGSQVESVTVNCYSTCIVSGDFHTGGLIGSAILGSIENCYFAGFVSGDPDTGALLGNQFMCTVTSSYFLDSSGPDNGYGVALNDTQMKTQTSYTNWDFIDDDNGSADIWFMAAGGYPKLTSQALATDIYLDGIINLKDYSLFAECWRNNDNNCDLNNDTLLDLNDLQQLAQDWLNSN